MDIILMLIPAALMFSIAALLVFRWSVKSDQYDDMEGEAYRILIDDDDMIPDGAMKKKKTVNQKTVEKSNEENMDNTTTDKP